MKKILNHLAFVALYFLIFYIGLMTGFLAVVIWPFLYFIFYLTIIILNNKNVKFYLKVLIYHISLYPYLFLFVVYDYFVRTKISMRDGFPFDAVLWLSNCIIISFFYFTLTYGIYILFQKTKKKKLD